MKKLKLKTIGLDAGEVLSRAQLKNVLGGNDDPRDDCDNGICIDGGGCPGFCGCGTRPVDVPGSDATYCVSVIV